MKTNTTAPIQAYLGPLSVGQTSEGMTAIVDVRGRSIAVANSSLCRSANENNAAFIVYACNAQSAPVEAPFVDVENRPDFRGNVIDTPRTNALEMSIPESAKLCEHFYEMQKLAIKIEGENAKLRKLLINAEAEGWRVMSSPLLNAISAATGSENPHKTQT